MNEWERKELEEYRKLGYRWEVSWRGYMVWFNDKFIHGAGLSPDVKTEHWKHQRADVEDNYKMVLATIRRDIDKRF